MLRKGCKPKPCSPAISTDLASLQGANNTEHSSLLSAVEDPGVVSSLLEHIKLLRVELVDLTLEVSSFRQELASLKRYPRYARESTMSKGDCLNLRIKYRPCLRVTYWKTLPT
ncbi:unnamed protein product [Danaus chrysippus]|uniref:(African queen) hypothetical protein n=1 Tax=Danaus chrysippus TaxID=151541 RepID=A0A8J2QI87_9NEOP|nr:unnamed protein product [Danaus chrysippus]